MQDLYKTDIYIDKSLISLKMKLYWKIYSHAYNLRSVFPLIGHKQSVPKTFSATSPK